MPNSQQISQSLTVWRERWYALNEAIAELVTEEDYPRRATLANMRDTLQLFAERQINFFFDGFGNQKESILEPCDDYPIDYVFQTLLQQVANDINVIRWAGIQRIWGYNSMKTALAISDQLAQKCLDVAIEHHLIDDTTALTYFQKSIYIRVIPYAPVALITVPETATHVKRDFLATPHEVGHYVFRHGKLNNGKTIKYELRQQVEQSPRWLKKWLEEIFADVYGCLIGGTVMGLDFQDILLDNARERFTRDDGKHPVAAIRPYIYTQVLRTLGFTTTADKLDARWDIWLVNRGAPTTFKLHEAEADGTTTHDLTQAKTQVATIVSKVLTVLAPIVTKHQANPRLCWTTDIDDDADLSKPESYNDPNGPLYGQFCQFLKQISTPLPTGFPELRQDPKDTTKAGIARGDNEPVNSRPKGDTGLWLDSLTTSDGNPTYFPPEVWKQFLSASGWTVRGPEGNWPP